MVALRRVEVILIYIHWCCVFVNVIAWKQHLYLLAPIDSVWRLIVKSALPQFMPALLA
jgi:hypothetical protein